MLVADAMVTLFTSNVPATEILLVFDVDDMVIVGTLKVKPALIVSVIIFVLPIVIDAGVNAGAALMVGKFVPTANVPFAI
jgi:hypothetical protein